MAFLRMLDAEWTKLRTVRSTLWTPVMMLPAILGLAILVGATRSLQADDTILGGSLTGVVIGQLVAAAFGALVMSTEYGSGMIASTFVACPARARVMAAKAVITMGISFMLGLVSGTGAFIVGLLMLSEDGYGTGDPMPALLGVAGTVATAAGLGVAFGAIIRSPAGSVAAVCGGIIMPSLLAPVFGDWQRWVAGASPVAVLQKLAQSSDAAADTVGTLGAWPSLGVLAAYTLATLVIGAWSLERRDA